jgi:hypothetical protein
MVLHLRERRRDEVYVRIVDNGIGNRCDGERARLGMSADRRAPA